MSELRSIFGVCPQHDILFDLLSPYEHLTFFAALKGVQRKDIANEVHIQAAYCMYSSIIVGFVFLISKMSEIAEIATKM